MSIINFITLAACFVGVIGVAALPAFVLASRAAYTASRRKVAAYLIAAILITIVTMAVASNVLLRIMRSLV